MNRVWLTGRITKKPELRYTPNNKAVCDFTIATNRPVVRDGEQKADFITCRVWNNQAENLCKYQDKGNLVGVVGELRADSYEVNGEKKYKTYIIVSQIEFLESKPKEDFKEASIKTDFQAPQQMEIKDSDLPF